MKTFRIVQFSLIGLVANTNVLWSQDQFDSQDTLAVNVATVQAYRIPTPSDRVSGNVHSLTVETLQNGKSPDLEDALNSLPGVRMETRGFGGSRRLQIRSSGVRAPFAVRNVHMLMDGFVLTNASGISPLDLWNPQWMNRLEVLKGPAGAIYGSGYGGVLLGTSLGPLLNEGNPTRITGFSRIATSGANQLSFSGLSSEVGFQCQSRFASDEWTVRVLLNETPGGRIHESNGRQQFELHRRKIASSNKMTHLWAGWMDASWELPGSLNANDANNNSDSSPGDAYDAHVDRMRTWLGWSQEGQKDNRQSGLWLYAQHSEKENPFGTSPFFNGFKAEAEQFASLRWWQAQTYQLPQGYRMTWDQTAIARGERLDLKESDLSPASNAYRYSITSTTANVWASSGIRIENETWQFDAQAAFEWMQRTTDGDGADESDNYVAINESYSHISLLPYFSLSRKAISNGRIFIQYGKASSHPTTFELVDPDNYTALNLLPERANAVELGWKGKTSLNDYLFSYSLQGYHQLVSDAIASVSGQNDGIYIDNVPGLQMTGLEAFLQADVQTGNGQITVQGQGSLNRHSFENVSGVLPGTPLHSASINASYHAKKWSLGCMHFWNDRMPLHDTKDDWSNAHQRLDAWVAVNSKASSWQLGVRNVLDASYSSWFQTNAFGGRYFNPAPRRMVWLSWKWKLN
jgi:iron complex outermembrane receptor protein